MLFTVTVFTLKVKILTRRKTPQVFETIPKLPYQIVVLILPTLFHLSDVCFWRPSLPLSSHLSPLGLLSRSPSLTPVDHNPPRSLSLPFSFSLYILPKCRYSFRFAFPRGSFHFLPMSNFFFYWKFWFSFVINVISSVMLPWICEEKMV